MIPKFKSKYIIGLLFLIFVTALFRAPSFFLSHNNNDELIHLSLAMKMERCGVGVFKQKKYNLHYIEKGIEPNRQLIGVLEGEEKIGSLLKGFLGERESMSHHPPVLPFILSISHRIFSRSIEYVVSFSKNTYLMIKNMPFQFYACIVPFVFSCLFVLSVYLLGSIFFSHKVGLISAFFLSLTPIEFLTANKIWADDMTAFFIVLSAILYLHALKSKRAEFALLSGLSCGISILTKMSGLYLVIVILLFHLFENRNQKVSFKNILNFFFEKNILYFLAGAFIVSAWWLDLYLVNFKIGRFVYHVGLKETRPMMLDWNPFLNAVYLRPWYSYLILVPYQAPIYLLVYIFIPLFILKSKLGILKNIFKENKPEIRFLIIWIITIFVLLSLKPNRELRFMLSAFPAIAVVCGYFIVCLFDFVNVKDKSYKRFAYGFIITLVSWSLFLSIKLGLYAVFFRNDMIRVPL